MKINKIEMACNDDSSTFKLYNDKNKVVKEFDVDRDDDSANAVIKALEAIFDVNIELEGED